ncbi:MAG: zinc ribbon domain-containing protein [Gemmatimonadaceae bacterium]
MIAFRGDISITLVVRLARAGERFVSYTFDTHHREGSEMPTYDYRCRACGQTFSSHESMESHDAGAALCPSCKSRDVERVMSSFYAKTPRKS